GPFETALGEFYTGNALPVAVGAFSEVNEDASKLITGLARLTAKTDFGNYLCDATTRVRFSDERASIDIDLRGSRTPRDVGVEACRAQSRIEQELTHPGVCSAFRWCTYFRRGGTAPLGVFVGRVALSLTSDLHASAVLQLRRGLKSRSLVVARSAQDESKSPILVFDCGDGRTEVKGSALGEWRRAQSLSFFQWT
ncbi:hypothetical protein THAOC_17205, partial [Thalassiosira oceanica]